MNTKGNSIITQIIIMQSKTIFTELRENEANINGYKENYLQSCNEAVTPKDLQDSALGLIKSMLTDAGVSDYQSKVIIGAVINYGDAARLDTVTTVAPKANGSLFEAIAEHCKGYIDAIPNKNTYPVPEINNGHTQFVAPVS